jgi:hypothetical protein
LLSAALTYNYVSEKGKIAPLAKKEISLETARFSAKLDKELGELKIISNDIAGKLVTGELKSRDIEETLQKLIKDNSGLRGIGVAHVPYVNVPNFREVSPNYVNRLGKENLEEQNLIQIFTVPFYHTDDSGIRITTGETFIDYPLDNIKEMISTLKLGKTGYVFIISQRGEFIRHPIEEYVKSGKTLFNVAEEMDNEELMEMAERAVRGEEGIIDHENEITGQSSWMFFKPISSTGWSTGVVLIKDEIAIDNTMFRHKFMKMAASYVVFAFFFLFFMFRLYEGKRKKVWIATALFSATIAVVILMLWNLILGSPFPSDENSVVIVSRVGLDKYLGRQESISRAMYEGELPIYVPTGAFIESIGFSGSDDIVMTGYLWQRYIDGIHDGISQGFVLPEAVSLDTKEAYRRREDDSEVVGWSFSAVLRQEFNYSKYPFDKKKALLRILHEDFDKNIILTPNLEAYNIMSPTALPGLEEDLVLPGWILESSYFSYEEEDSSTNYGIKDYKNREDFPDLCFNVNMKRDYVEPFISNGISMLVAAGILFFLLMVISKAKNVKEDRAKSLTLISSCVGLFFAMLLSHNRLRGALMSKEVIYFEYFYFITFTALLLVAINAFIFYSGTSIRFIQYKDNLVPKMLFWPTILLMILLVTLAVFY